MFVYKTTSLHESTKQENPNKPQNAILVMNTFLWEYICRQSMDINGLMSSAKMILTPYMKWHVRCNVFFFFFFFFSMNRNCIMWEHFCISELLT